MNANIFLRKNKRRILAGVVIIVAWLLNQLTIAATPQIQVKAYGQHAMNGIVYRYELINSSPSNAVDTFSVTRFELGKTGFTEEKPALTVEPIGESSSDGIMSPSGWRGHTSGEEAYPDTTTIVWEIDASSNLSTRQDSVNLHKLSPGQALAGFSVTLPESDSAYLSSYFFVTTNDAKTYTGAVERVDTTPPTLTVNANPVNLWPPNGKPVNISVAITAKDDYDPQPEIKLESITANEVLASGDILGAALGTGDRQFSLIAKRDGNNKAGRLYTITYSATDASGNKSTASTTVTVPHDQRK